MGYKVQLTSDEEHFCKEIAKVVRSNPTGLWTVHDFSGWTDELIESLDRKGYIFFDDSLAVITMTQSFKESFIN